MAPPPLDRRDLHEHPWKRRAVTTWTHIPNPAGLYRPKEIIPINFLNLYDTAPRAVGGSRFQNRNVLFAAESLEAASKLAVVACEMANFKRNNVHFALLGRDDIDIEVFKQLNGISTELGGCNVAFHDARAEMVSLMTKNRMKLAMRFGLRHLHEFIHPQAVFFSVEHEEEWFMDMARKTAGQLQMQMLELPSNTIDELRWITRLDSGSLEAFRKPSFEIVIHADKHSGNLERLLKSLQTAAYPFGHHPKSLTVILDPSSPFHGFTKSFLSDYSFPSRTRTFIRRPINPASSAEDTAKRFMESFYPSNDDTFLLVLDANVELSKWYFHYILWTTLEYKYSLYQKLRTASLFGISLEEPPSFINGTKPFTTPSGEPSPFLYTAPSSRAALYFPQHWIEFHSYFSQSLLFPTMGAAFTNQTNLTRLTMSKEISDSWSTSFINLIRSRGYVMLYPSFHKEALAIVHNETPSYTRTKHGFEKTLMDKNNVMRDLPAQALPIYNTIALVDWWGRSMQWDKLELDALRYRQATSSCPTSLTAGFSFDAGDLFCDENGKRLLWYQNLSLSYHTL
ncbi:uncharacterized protein H6S33_009071 [Morchella sextelata]|uniref:uncharacterized protein n=1 Tax=Morchella sextelata TaxID=1174677 RepID=UPI001D036011|nr:uncharacterized protein H6S33_009071 [Morchella sextelata]KAH0612691.1 hypothetical protein H6S33_009071 [Morchella sextelata]